MYAMQLLGAKSARAKGGVTMSDTLADPVCGRPVDPSSKFQATFGGALFSFCGLDCMERFSRDPGAFVQLSAPQEAEAFPVLRQSPATGLFDFDAHRADGAAGSADPAHADLVPWWRRVQVSLRDAFSPMREKREAYRLSDDLLQLHRDMSAMNPGLRGRELYREVVLAYTGVSSQQANAFLDQAEESFASWPVSRPLNFADVVHYLVVSDLLAVSATSPWLRASVGRIVSKRIPSNL
jgi:YHS domain-containing protein